VEKRNGERMKREVNKIGVQPEEGKEERNREKDEVVRKTQRR
jgi:hypothetical protein